MSADSIGRETPPAFPAALLATALAEMREQPADAQQAELAIMRARTPSLAALHQEFDRYRDSTRAHQTSACYLLGHRVLRYAIPDQPLPQHPLETMRDYLQLVATDPRRLESDVARDYADHETVLAMVDDGLRFPDSRFGARLMFAIHGRLANPGRSPIRIPPAQNGGGSQRRTGQREQIQRRQGGPQAQIRRG